MAAAQSAARQRDESLKQLNELKHSADEKKKVRSSARILSRKMAALELVGPLLAIVARAEVLCGGPVRMWVDNSGSCSIWKHGYSGSCKISTTVVRAVAAALGCKVDICKITRCSTSGAEMADAVSKADFGWFRRAGGRELAAAPVVVPLELLRWWLSALRWRC